jgi:hypothetical protein
VFRFLYDNIPSASYSTHPTITLSRIITHFTPTTPFHHHSPSFTIIHHQQHDTTPLSLPLNDTPALPHYRERQPGVCARLRASLGAGSGRVQSGPGRTDVVLQLHAPVPGATSFLCCSSLRSFVIYSSVSIVLHFYTIRSPYMNHLCSHPFPLHHISRHQRLLYQTCYDRGTGRGRRGSARPPAPLAPPTPTTTWRRSALVWCPGGDRG